MACEHPFSVRGKCTSCGAVITAPPTPEPPDAGTIPVDRLAKLVHEWREEAGANDSARFPGAVERRVVLDRCADDLAALVDEAEKAARGPA